MEFEVTLQPPPVLEVTLEPPPQFVVELAVGQGPAGPPGSGGSGGGSGLPSVNYWGQVSSVTDGATATLVNIPFSLNHYRIQGFIATGNGDGYIFLQVNNLTVLSSRIKWSVPTTIIELPNPISVTNGATVTLKVTNESGSTANFEATLLGE